MAVIPAFLMRHTVLIEPFEGTGPFGPSYGAQVPVTCFVEEKRRLVRSADAAEVISETTIYAPPGTVCPPESRVTVNGRITYAIGTPLHDGGGLPTPDHLEVALQ